MLTSPIHKRHVETLGLKLLKKHVETLGLNLVLTHLYRLVRAQDCIISMQLTLIDIRPSQGWGHDPKIRTKIEEDA